MKNLFNPLLKKIGFSVRNQTYELKVHSGSVVNSMIL